MRELKRLNKFLIKYKGRLLLGLLITIVSRVFSLVTPRLVGDSMTTIENYLIPIDDVDDYDEQPDIQITGDGYSYDLQVINLNDNYLELFKSQKLYN